MQSRKRHSSSGWTYHATAFVPGGTVIAQLSTDHSTDDGVDNDSHFAYKRTNLATVIDGTGLEGTVVAVTAAVNNSIDYLNVHLGVNT